jgi:hypothetical protein
MTLHHFHVNLEALDSTNLKLPEMAQYRKLQLWFLQE